MRLDFVPMFRKNKTDAVQRRCTVSIMSEEVYRA